MVPRLEMANPKGGRKITAKFDGVDGNFVIDRKLNPYFSAKSIGQVLRQARVARYNGVRVRWELPSPAAKAAAKRLLAVAGRSNRITVKVVPFR